MFIKNVYNFKKKLSRRRYFEYIFVLFLKLSVMIKPYVQKFCSNQKQFKVFFDQKVCLKHYKIFSLCKFKISIPLILKKKTYDNTLTLFQICCFIH